MVLFQCAGEHQDRQIKPKCKIFFRFSSRIVLLYYIRGTFKMVKHVFFLNRDATIYRKLNSENAGCGVKKYINQAYDQQFVIGMNYDW